MPSIPPRSRSAAAPSAAPGVPTAPRGAAVPQQPAEVAVDLTALHRFDPDAAQLGFQLNHTGSGGIDLDGNPNALTWSELVTVTRGLNEGLLGWRERRALAVLRQAFHWPAVAYLVRPSTGLGLPPPGGATSLEAALSVQLPQGAPQPCASHATAAFNIDVKNRSGSARVGFPFPSDRAHQEVDEASLSLRVVDGNGREVDAVLKHELVYHGEGDARRAHLFVDLDLARLPSPAFLRWDVDVQTRDARLDLSTPVPITALSDVPDDAKAWLHPAPMIQSDHPEMKALAARIRQGATTVQDLAQRTLDAITALRRPFTQNDLVFDNDALSFLRTGLGECTAHGNLFAALMRANGVPCRVVTGISRGIGYPMNMHYQNEYLLLGKGWVHVEPQGTSLQTPRFDMVHTGVVSPKMEQQGHGLEGYLGVHALTMAPMEVDPRTDEPIPFANANVRFSAALLCPTSPVPGAGLHGAT